MPMVLALLVASSVLACVRPTAAPAALSSAVRRVAMPTATSHPKNAEPQRRPPNFSRWRYCISLARSRAGVRGEALVRVAAWSFSTTAAARLPVSELGMKCLLLGVRGCPRHQRLDDMRLSCGGPRDERLCIEPSTEFRDGRRFRASAQP